VGEQDGLADNKKSKDMITQMKNTRFKEVVEIKG